MSGASSRQPLDVALGEMLEQCGYGTVLYNTLSSLQRLVGEERLRNMGKLAAAVPWDGLMPRVKHLLYFLLRDELTIGELEALLAQVVQAVQLGGVVMGATEPLVTALAQRIVGPIDGQFEEVADGQAG